MINKKGRFVKGHFVTKKVRKKISKAHTGIKRKPFSEETRKKMSLTHKGMIFSEEHKNNISQNNVKYWLGKHQSQKTKLKNSLAHIGKKHTEKTKRKMSIIHKGKKLSKEAKIKISLSHKGEKAYNWKGNQVGKTPLHRWLRKNKPKSKFCEKCKKEKKLCLANMNNHHYTRNPNDYKWLCYSCHSKFDYLNRRNRKKKC
jgi:hypothetical protein